MNLIDDSNIEDIVIEDPSKLLSLQREIFYKVSTNSIRKFNLVLELQK